MNFQQLREKYKSPYNRELNEKLKDPPPVLVLRRTGVRDFPTGERVALYYNQKLGLTFSVPYGSSKTVVSAVSEKFINEEYMSEQVLRQLETIIKNNEMNEVQFKNGSISRVDVTTAKYVLELYNQMSIQNRRKLSQMISTNPENLSKVSQFAFKNLK